MSARSIDTDPTRRVDHRDSRRPSRPNGTEARREFTFHISKSAAARRTPHAHGSALGSHFPCRRRLLDRALSSAQRGRLTADGVFPVHRRCADDNFSDDAATNASDGIPASAAGRVSRGAAGANRLANATGTAKCDSATVDAR
jgi:hypothetical protein